MSQSSKMSSEVSTGAQAELVFFFAGAEAGRAFFDDEGGEAVGALALIGDGDDDRYVGVVAVGDEGLVAVEDPLVAFADGGGAGGGGVGAGAGLGESPGAEPFAGGEFGDVLLLLGFVAGEEDVVGAERIVRGDDDADGAIDGGELFDGEHVVDVAEAGAAVFGREDDAEEAHLAELFDDVVGEFGGFVPAEDVGGDFAGGEVANFAAEGFLVFGEGEGEGERRWREGRNGWSRS